MNIKVDKTPRGIQLNIRPESAICEYTGYIRGGRDCISCEYSYGTNTAERFVYCEKFDQYAGGETVESVRVHY